MAYSWLQTHACSAEKVLWRRILMSCRWQLNDFTALYEERQRAEIEWCERERKKTFFFPLQLEQSSVRGRESERWEGAHCPHVAEQLPAELTSARLNDNTSRWPSNSDLWPLAVHQVLRNVQPSDRCAGLSSARPQSIAATVKQYLGKEGTTRHSQKGGKSLLAECWCSSFSLFLSPSLFFALVKNICRECVSVKSLLCGRGQRVTMSLWVTAVMASWGYI